MLHLVCGINSRLPSVNHALISPILPHPVVWVALPPSVPSTHHFHHLSPLHSFIPGLKPSFSANLSHNSLSFLLVDRLHGYPGLFTHTSERIRLWRFSFFFFFHVFSLVLYGKLSWPMSAFEHTLSYRIVSVSISILWTAKLICACWELTEQ